MFHYLKLFTLLLILLDDFTLSDEQKSESVKDDGEENGNEVKDKVEHEQTDNVVRVNENGNLKMEIKEDAQQEKETVEIKDKIDNKEKVEEKEEEDEEEEEEEECVKKEKADNVKHEKYESEEEVEIKINININLNNK